jgi:subtilase family serine protease
VALEPTLRLTMRPAPVEGAPGHDPAEGSRPAGPGPVIAGRTRLRAAGLAVVGALVLAAGGCSSPAGTARETARASPPSCLTQALCYAPRQFQVAYGIAPLLDDGIDGRGQTVVLLEFAAGRTAAPPRITDIRQDLARFDSLFGLPVARLQIVKSLARSASPWLANEEEVEDTEIVHAVAPQAGIREVLISDAAQASATNASADVAAALRLGLTQGAVISFSRSWGEQCFTPAEVAQLNSALQAARDHDVTVVNSSGDIGAASNPCPGAGTAFNVFKGVNLLDSDPLTLAAGGTSLRANRATGGYVGETVWNTPPGQSPLGFSLSSGGGFSQVFPRPAYQDGVPGIGAARGVPDVAADADGDTGMAMALSYGGQKYVLDGTSGTSAAAPLWAAVIALADQYADHPLGFVNPAIYRIGRSSLYHQAFHDITKGTNTVQFPLLTIAGYHAAPGWNPATGWGSPNAQVLVPLLARYAG